MRWKENQQKTVGLRHILIMAWPDLPHSHAAVTFMRFVKVFVMNETGRKDWEVR